MVPYFIRQLQQFIESAIKADGDIESASDVERRLQSYLEETEDETLLEKARDSMAVSALLRLEYWRSQENSGKITSSFSEVLATVTRIPRELPAKIKRQLARTVLYLAEQLYYRADIKPETVAIAREEVYQGMKALAEHSSEHSIQVRMYELLALYNNRHGFRTTPSDQERDRFLRLALTSGSILAAEHLGIGKKQMERITELQSGLAEYHQNQLDLTTYQRCCSIYCRTGS